MTVSAVVCLFAPTVLAIVFIKKRGAKWRSFLIGAAVFAVFQILTRIPLLSWMQTTAWFTLFTMTQPVLYILMLAFTAGLFEEVGRFAGIQLLRMPGMLDWDNAFVFGLGHGGLEALWLVGINYGVAVVQSLFGQVPAAVISTPSVYFLVGGLERVLVIAMHIGFTMLVFYAVKERKPLYLLAAIAAHTVVDAAVPLLRQAGIPLGLWGSEGVLAVLAVLLIVVMVRLKPLLKAEGFNNEGGSL
jgi:uncharacterized membrane protein YhfC